MSFAIEAWWPGAALQANPPFTPPGPRLRHSKRPLRKAQRPRAVVLSIRIGGAAKRQTPFSFGCLFFSNFDVRRAGRRQVARVSTRSLGCLEERPGGKGHRAGTSRCRAPRGVAVGNGISPRRIPPRRRALRGVADVRKPATSPKALPRSMATQRCRPRNEVMGPGRHAFPLRVLRAAERSVYSA